MILASIVLYNPDMKRLHENVNSIINQVDAVVMVDNGSSNFQNVKETFTDNRILFIDNKKNLGIADALNKAMQYAAENQYDWVLTLDQDSVSPENLVVGLSRHLSKERIGIIAPNYQDRNANRLTSKDRGWKYVNRCITSASLTNVEIWKSIGGFDEALFIDYVDYDYCARLIREGYAIILDSDVMILHEIGNCRRIYFGNHAYTLWNHSPMRDYYLVRNASYYCAVYPDVWDMKREKRFIQLRCLMILLFEKQKWKKMVAILRGKHDAKKLIKDGKKRNKERLDEIKKEIAKSDKGEEKNEN